MFPIKVYSFEKIIRATPGSSLVICNSARRPKGYGSGSIYDIGTRAVPLGASRRYAKILILKHGKKFAKQQASESDNH